VVLIGYFYCDICGVYEEEVNSFLATGIEFFYALGMWIKDAIFLIGGMK
jgi:hypothetical protein